MYLQLWIQCGQFNTFNSVKMKSESFVLTSFLPRGDPPASQPAHMVWPVQSEDDTQKFPRYMVLITTIPIIIIIIIIKITIIIWA